MSYDTTIGIAIGAAATIILLAGAWIGSIVSTILRDRLLAAATESVTSRLTAEFAYIQRLAELAEAGDMEGFIEAKKAYPQVRATYGLMDQPNPPYPITDITDGLGNPLPAPPPPRHKPGSVVGYK